MPILELEAFLPYRLSRVAELISREFREIYDPQFDLTVPEWRVLAALGQKSTMTATQIGEHVWLHKTKVSRAVQALDTRRWLTRREARDRRVEELSLTAAGRSAYNAIVPRAQAFDNILTARLGISRNEFLAALTSLEQQGPARRRRRKK